MRLSVVSPAPVLFPQSLPSPVVPAQYSSKPGEPNFHTNIYYMGSRSQRSFIDPPKTTRVLSSGRDPQLTQRPSLEELVTTSRLDEGTSALIKLVEKLSLQVNRLELQQESSGACTLKRFGDLEAEFLRLRGQADDAKSKAGDSGPDTEKLEKALKDLDQRERHEMGEVQAALGYLKDRLFAKLSDIEDFGSKSARQQENSAGELQSLLSDAINAYKAENEKRLSNIEGLLTQVAESQVKVSCDPDTIEKITQNVQIQVGDMVKSGILEYARRKDEEDLKRLSQLDRRVEELAAAQKSSMEKTASVLDSCRVEGKLMAKRDATHSQHFRQVEERMAALHATTQEIQCRESSNAKLEKTKRAEYEAKIDQTVKEMHVKYGGEIDRLDEKIGKFRKVVDEAKEVAESAESISRKRIEELGVRVDCWRKALEDRMEEMHERTRAACGAAEGAQDEAKAVTRRVEELAQAREEEKNEEKPESHIEAEELREKLEGDINDLRGKLEALETKVDKSIANLRMEQEQHKPESEVAAEIAHPPEEEPFNPHEEPILPAKSVAEEEPSIKLSVQQQPSQEEVKVVMDSLRPPEAQRDLPATGSFQRDIPEMGSKSVSFRGSEVGPQAKTDVIMKDLPESPALTPTLSKRQKPEEEKGKEEEGKKKEEEKEEEKNQHKEAEEEKEKKPEDGLSPDEREQQERNAYSAREPDNNNRHAPSPSPSEGKRDSGERQESDPASDWDSDAKRAAKANPEENPKADSEEEAKTAKPQASEADKSSQREQRSKETDNNKQDSRAAQADEHSGGQRLFEDDLLDIVADLERAPEEKITEAKKEAPVPVAKRMYYFWAQNVETTNIRWERCGVPEGAATARTKGITDFEIQLILRSRHDGEQHLFVRTDRIIT